jgi:alkylation response protein AidB-like acyl-CoA dehydrogenase
MLQPTMAELRLDDHKAASFGPAGPSILSFGCRRVGCNRISLRRASLRRKIVTTASVSGKWRIKRGHSVDFQEFCDEGSVMDNSVGQRAVPLNHEVGLAHPRPLGRARAISGLISDEALASERLGRLTDKVAEALLNANLFSIRLPEADGGLGGTGVELFEATEEIARADGSAGWCMLISNAISTFVHSGAGAKARREVFGSGPVACWATLLPKARSAEVEGGFRVSGNFAWGSSSSLSRWVLVAEPLNDRDGQQWFRAHLLPKEDVEIKEGSWDVMGLRATASIDYVISNKFVPAHRAFEYPFLSDGNPQHASALGLIELGRPGMAAFASGIGARSLN